MAAVNPWSLSIGSNHGTLLRSLLSYIRGPMVGYNFIGGMVPANGTDATNDIDCSAGACVSNAGHIIPFPAAFSAQVDTKFNGTLGTPAAPAGGVPSGISLSNESIHLFALLNPSRGTTGVMFDRSTTAANAIADTTAAANGLTEYRRIFSFKRITAANQVVTATEIAGGGIEALLSVPVRDFASTNPGTSAVTWTTSCPTGVKLRAIVDIALYSSGGAGLNISGLLRSPDQADTAPTANLRNFFLEFTGSPGFFSGPGAEIRALIRTDTSATIRYRLSASDANTNVDGVSNGWIDDRIS